MLRKDGEATFYLIETQDKKDEWYQPNYDYLGYPHVEFTASGRCWQELGIHGVFDQEIASQALLKYGKRNPDLKLRLVRVHIIQEKKELLILNNRA